jgi:hypothetical protein
MRSTFAHPPDEDIIVSNRRIIIEPGPSAEVEEDAALVWLGALHKLRGRQASRQELTSLENGSHAWLPNKDHMSFSARQTCKTDIASA